jgi:hypothetical protein
LAHWHTNSPSAVAVWGIAQAGVRAVSGVSGRDRTIIYTTSAIESLNYQLRKVTKARRPFPSGAAALKLRYPAIRNINPKRAVSHGHGCCRAPQPTGDTADLIPLNRLFERKGFLKNSWRALGDSDVTEAARPGWHQYQQE